jgi:hypothetical protein
MAPCDAHSWPTIEEFVNAKKDFLAGFLKLPNDIPSHDVFNRVFADPGHPKPGCKSRNDQWACPNIRTPACSGGLAFYSVGGRTFSLKCPRMLPWGAKFMVT